jgi:outer membrane lipoprotein-sorting protein
MKNKLKYHLLFLLYALLPFKLALAQNFQQDYKQMQEAYNKLDKFYCEVKVKIYESDRAVTPNEIISSVIKKQKDDFWYSMGSIKMIVNEKCILYIDEREKQMIYTIRDRKREMKIPSQDVAAMIDSLVQKSDSVVYTSGKDNCKGYIIYASKALITKTVLFIDRENALVKTIEYYYNPAKAPASNKIIIEYSKMDTAPVFTDVEFSEKKYVAYAGKVLKPNSPYGGYKTSVIDQNEFK